MKRMQIIFLVLIYNTPIILTAKKLDYCTAIRGNGELAPAHWSALSRLVENWGLPQKSAGGSSATITMFFLEAISANPYTVIDNEKAVASYFLKSLPYYFKELAKTENAIDAYNFMNNLLEKNSTIVSSFKLGIAVAKNYSEVKRVLGKYFTLINSELLEQFKFGNFLNAKNKLVEAISVFGKYDVENDKLLFFRPGIIDFTQLAIFLGQTADFYAGMLANNPKAQSKLLRKQEHLLNKCAALSVGKLWSELPSSCKTDFNKLVRSYILSTSKPNYMIYQPLKNSIASTSIIKGESYKKIIKYMTNFKNTNMNQNIDLLANYTVDVQDDLFFGYWSDKNTMSKLKEIYAHLKTSDFKSNKFLSLGQANWMTILSTSPVEPGLGNFQKIPFVNKLNSNSANSKVHYNKYSDNIISAGGWSDLAPTAVLRHAGCEKIVYITRKGGQSIFGQQLFIRLAGEQTKVEFWKDLKNYHTSGVEVSGSKAENTFWNQSYNLANKSSSFNTSLKEADFIYCTDWDAYNTFKGDTISLVKHSYYAPMYYSKNSLPIKEPYNYNSYLGLAPFNIAGCTSLN